MLFSVIFAFLLQVNTLIDVCPAFGIPVTGGGYDANWNEITLDSLAIQALVNLLAGNSFWLGYERGGFAPAYFESDPALTLTLYTADGGERWIDVTEHAGVYYVLAYAQTVAYAAAPARLRANAAAGALVGYAKFTLVSIFERRRRYSSIISHLS